MFFLISNKSTKDCLKKDSFCCKLKVTALYYCVLSQLEMVKLMRSLCIFSCEIKAIGEAFILLIKK